MVGPDDPGFKEARAGDVLASPATRRPRIGLVLPSFDMGTPFVDLTQANRVAVSLEDEAMAQRLSSGRVDEGPGSPSD